MTSTPLLFAPALALQPRRSPTLARPRPRLRPYYPPPLLTPTRRASASLTKPTPPRSLTPTPTSATSTSPTPTPSQTPLYDILVVGAGPAGLSLAAALATQGLSVCCADPALDRPWPNHYGVWEDEFAAVGLEHCAASRYERTSVFSGPGNIKMLLDRPYIRVDRIMLKRTFVQRCIDGNVVLLSAPVRSVRHVCQQWSDVELGPSVTTTDHNNDQSTQVDSDGLKLRARLVMDCTGHALQFTEVQPQPGELAVPWEQAAYGIEAEVDAYPFSKDEMVLMDFRDDHMDGALESEQRPTFLYVFPEGERRAFFEETSVIQPEAVPFDELRDRLVRRLQRAGIKVTKVIEEERSLIPMGGSLPDRQQRVVAFGGAAVLVHPATGYMVGRTVRLAQELAVVVKRGLDDVGTDGNIDQVARMCWDETWSLGLRRQRDFLWFGAELLGRLGMNESRSFFQAFFKLPRELWVKFLAYELNSPALRIMFALRFFAVADNEIRVRLLRSIAEIGGWRLIRSTLPDWMTAWEED